MNLGFLCYAQRAELTRKPEQAIRCWQNGFDAGQVLCGQKRWQEAVPYLGSALETSEILMTIEAVKPTFAQELFKSSAFLLIDVYARIGAKVQCEQVYRIAALRLQRESLCHPEARTDRAQHIQQLYSRVHQFDGKSRRQKFRHGVLSA